MYDVEVQGVADKPQLKFYDRGTFSQAVELGAVGRPRDQAGEGAWRCGRRTAAPPP